MSEISLNAYLSKMDALLSASEADEVIQHCRHILKTHPKNIATHRALGRALLMTGRRDEARTAFRFVLSAIPDDITAHLGMSEINEREHRPNEAIWHLERAYELRPSDPQLIALLRDLHQRHRGVQNTRLQLTAGAVARQYRRAGATAQAINALRDALERQPKRADLRILLAQILWETGSAIDAGEEALEVVKMLPDCLEANRILASLWLSVDRPSDAGYYVNRVESLDPYGAVTLVQNETPPDEAFMLEELDYAVAAKREAVNARPDWLQDIGADNDPFAGTEATAGGGNQQEIDWTSAILARRTLSPDEMPTPTNTAPDNESDLPDLSDFQALPVVSSDDTDDELEAIFGLPAGDAEDRRVDASTSLFEQPTDTGDLRAVFEATDAEDDGFRYGNGEETPIAELDDDDEDEALDFGDLFATNHAPSQPVGNPADDYFNSDLTPALTVADGFDEEDEDLPLEDENDPFAWMEDAGVAFIPDAPSKAERYRALLEEDIPTIEQSDDPLAWMQEYTTGTPDAEALASTETPADAQEDPFAMPSLAALMNEDDAMSDFEWMENSGESVDDAPKPPPERRGLTAILQSSDLDWLTKGGNRPSSESTEASDDDDPFAGADDWLAQFGVERPAAQPEVQPDVVADSLDWLGSISEEAFEEELSLLSEQATEVVDPSLLEMDDDALAGFASSPVISPSPAQEEFISMADDPRNTPEPEEPTSGDETPDWLSAFESIPAYSEETDDEVAPSDPYTATGDINELIAAIDTLPIDEAPRPTPAKDPDEDLAPSFDWMQDEDDGEDAIPTWLTEESSTDEVVASADISDSPWTITELSTSSSDDEASAEISAMPDWLAEIAGADTGSFDELTVEDSAEPVTADAADTLMVKPEMDEEFDLEAMFTTGEGDADFETVTIDSDEDAVFTGEAVAEPVSADEMPDWLSEVVVDGETVEALTTAPAADFETTTIDSDEDAVFTGEAVAEPVSADEMPDWLSEVVVDGETVEALTTPKDASQLEDLFAAPEMSAESMAETAEDAFDEMMTNEDDLDAIFTGIDLSAEENEFNFEDVETTETAFGLTTYEDTPEWLTVLSEASDEQEEVMMIPPYDTPQDDEREPIDEFGFEDEIDRTPAINAPDWLNAMVPGLDVDYDAREQTAEVDYQMPVADEADAMLPMMDVSQPARVTDFAWLTRIVEEEQKAPAATRIGFQLSKRPRWLTSAPTPTALATDDDFPDWPEDDSDLPVWLR